MPRSQALCFVFSICHQMATPSFVCKQGNSATVEVKRNECMLTTNEMSIIQMRLKSERSRCYDIWALDQVSKYHG